jgi:Flp pilus assembly protein TadD
MTAATRALSLALLVLMQSGCAVLAPGKHPAPDTPAAQAASNAAQALQSGNYPQSLQLYQERLDTAPQDKAALLGVGESYLGLGQADLALTTFRQLLTLAPDNAGALEGSGLAYLGLQQQDKAAATLHKALLRQPQNWRALDALGLIADMQGQYRDAQGWYEKALDSNDHEAAIYNNYGYSRIMAHDYQQAEALLSRALELSPGNTRIRNNLMQALAWQGRYQEAVNLHGDIPQYVAENNVGYIARLRHENAAAQALFQSALDNSPSWYALAATNLDYVKRPAATH